MPNKVKSAALAVHRLNCEKENQIVGILVIDKEGILIIITG